MASHNSKLILELYKILFHTRKKFWNRTIFFAYILNKIIKIYHFFMPDRNSFVMK